MICLLFSGTRAAVDDPTKWATLTTLARAIRQVTSSYSTRQRSWVLTARK
jgi:hypothetical protein